jgi:DNA-binding transcriptional LysR family regulator
MSNIDFAFAHKLGVMQATLRQLELFRLLMQTRNVTETARLMRISQPAASQTLKELEQRLGFPLFVRAGNRISPTAEARALIGDVEQVFLRMTKMGNLAEELRDTTAGSLTVSTIATITGSILPQALASFHAQRPAVELMVNSFTARDVAQAVIREEADLGIVYGPVDDHAVAVEPLLQTRIVAMLPPDHPLADEARIDVRHIAEHALIVLDRTVPPGRLVYERLARGRARTRGLIEVNLSFAALSMVRHGIGLVLTDPIILLSGLASDLVVRPVDPPVDLTLCLLYSRQRALPRTAMQFQRDLRAAMQDAASRLRALGVAAETV